MDEVNGSTSDGYHTFDELYEHRIVLYMALCRKMWALYTPVWMSRKHSDGSEFAGWFVLGIHTETGKQITYHLPDRFWGEAKGYANVLEKAPDYDGHTASDVLERIKALGI